MTLRQHNAAARPGKAEVKARPAAWQAARAAPSMAVEGSSCNAS